jgi:hypothetical protein
MSPVIKKIAIGIGSWALICLVGVLPKSNRIASTLGGGWKSVLLVYGILFIGGMAILPIFLTLDRIQSEKKKFAAQMIACLLIAIVALIGIGIYTF